MARVAVAMTVHNRRFATLRCLASIEGQIDTDAEVTTYVVDDGSTDGTAEAIRRRFPDVVLIEGDGSLFWNGGMRLALESATRSEVELVWWLNDDVVLDPDSLSRLFRTIERLKQEGNWPSVVVGTVRDPEEGFPTYGGIKRPYRWKRFRSVLIRPGRDPIPADTMNGNCVLVPIEVVERVGNLDPDYIQKFGDLDYGFRVRSEGFQIWVAPGSFGTCARHDSRTPGGSLSSELKRLWSAKELPFSAWARFTRRWGGPLWFVYFLSPYVKQGGKLILSRIFRLWDAARRPDVE